MLRHRPTLFIGSSSEGLQVAEALQSLLDHSCQVQVWSQGTFGLGTGTLESLVAATGQFDFAVLVLTPDDVAISREKTSNAPRDNVLFELGLFMGALGRNRTYIVHSRTANLKLPSDLAGVTAATYQLHSNENLESSLGAAASLIKKTIEKLGTRPSIRLGQASDSDHQGIRLVRPKYKFEPEFWLRVLAESNSSLDIVGNALNTWCEAPYATAYEFQIKKIISNGGQVRLGLLDPNGAAHARLRARTGTDYSKRIAETLQFISERIVNAVPKTSRKRLCITTLSDTDLPYMAIRTDESVLVAPYFSQNDSKKHGIMMVLDRESQFGTGFLGDMEQIFASGKRVLY